MSSEIVACPGRSGRQLRTGHSPAREIVKFLVAEQDLDHPDIHLLLQEVSGKTVPQRMH